MIPVYTLEIERGAGHRLALVETGLVRFMDAAGEILRGEGDVDGWVAETWDGDEKLIRLTLLKLGRAVFRLPIKTTDGWPIEITVRKWTTGE